jgi:hypothetical protein
MPAVLDGGSRREKLYRAADRDSTTGGAANVFDGSHPEFGEIAEVTDCLPTVRREAHRGDDDHRPVGEDGPRGQGVAMKSVMSQEHEVLSPLSRRESLDAF